MNDSPSLRRTGPITLGALALLVLQLQLAHVGCHAPIEPDDRTTGRAAIPDFEWVWQETLNTLRRLGFTPDRQDRANRIIVTLPETSKQWFEGWRQDVQGGYATLESSLHTIRRRVRVEFQPDERDTAWTVAVRVDILRYSTPERQVTSASGALGLFSARVPTTEGERFASTADPARLVELGRDATMERRILERILVECDPAVTPTESAAP
ncbi:MAG: hypothetical protein V3T70_09605 [Phycisphaerae bacterium]